MLHIPTPVLPVPQSLSGLIPFVSLKLEILQPVGSFKIRGIGHLCEHYKNQGCSRIIAASGGNAGVAASYSAKQLGLPATVFVPENTRQAYLKRILAHDAEVKQVGKNLDDATEAAKEYCDQVNGGFTPPYNHPLIWEGNSSVIDELVSQINKPDAILMSVGGGGLMLGVLQGLKRHGWDDIPLIGAETEGAASLHACFAQKAWAKLPSIDSIATTLGAKQIARELYDQLPNYDVRSVVLSDKQAVQGALRCLDDYHILLEPACGVLFAALYEKADYFRGFNHIAVILCGGVGMSLNHLNEVRTQFGL